MFCLGDDVEGWELVVDVSCEDNYNIVVYNFVILKDWFNEFCMFECDGIILWMLECEVDFYGEWVLCLFVCVKWELGSCYEVVIDKLIVVEIFFE